MLSTENENVSLEELAYSGKLRSAPFSDIAIEIEGNKIFLDGGSSRATPQSSAPLRDFLWSARQSNPASLIILEPQEYSGSKIASAVNAPRLVLEAPSIDGEYYICLTVVDQDGLQDTSVTYFVVEEGQPRLEDWTWENTGWVDTTVIYGVIPRNFGSPGFQAITNRLDYLRDLGIDALWLAPINTTPPDNYGYHVTNYLELADRNGSKEDFRRLVDEAHQRGIRVLMDFVPNHTSEHHRYFQDTLQNKQASRYWDFYDRDETGTHTHYFHWTYLPNLNFSNPEVVRWITEAFCYWVREFDVDGFRVDVAWGIRQRNPEYWPMWRQALKRIKPDLLLLAEAGARDAYYFTEGYDAAYDWTDELGHWAWENVFVDRDQLTARLHDALTNHGRGYHADALIFRFLNNNDTAERFITRFGVEMTRVATALLLTLPGVPCLYTGDEIGAEFMPYKNPDAISWDQDRQCLLNYHKKLIALRKNTPALHSRQWQILEVEPRQQVYGYLRWTGGDAKPVLVLLNFFDTVFDAKVNIPPEFDFFTQSSQLLDLLSGMTVAVQPDKTLRIQIPPMTAYLLTGE